LAVVRQPIEAVVCHVDQAKSSRILMYLWRIVRCGRLAKLTRPASGLRYPFEVVELIKEQTCPAAPWAMALGLSIETPSSRAEMA